LSLKILNRDELIDKVCVVVGTRPSIVKQSPVIRELIKRNVPHLVLHTGQHYSYDLDQAFFEDLELATPEYRLKGIKDLKFHGEQTSEMLRQIEQIFIKEKPKTVLVGGDANSNLAAALAARKLNLNLAHNESGVRSFKWNVPEEHNRVIIDHISDYLFVPQEDARKQLVGEKVRGRIYETGSTTSDAVSENIKIANEKSTVLNDLSLKKRSYVVVTTHHEENVDYKDELTRIVEGLQKISCEIDYQFLFPLHPRTKHRLKYFGLYQKLFSCDRIRPLKPLGYLDFLTLVGGAAMVISDSGGLIQEAAIHKVPCLTLGKYTEWMECVNAGANKISMNDPELMLKYSLEFLNCNEVWEDPFGGPGAAGKIVDILEQSFNDPQIV
jgi:UDP-N-acetylglucosamine 2-epimerase (non-hydrolysing)